MFPTMAPPPGTQSKSRSIERSVAVKPSVEKQTQVPENRITVVVTVLLVVGMIALAIWVALTGDTSKIDAIWDAYLN